MKRRCFVFRLDRGVVLNLQILSNASRKLNKIKGCICRAVKWESLKEVDALDSSEKGRLTAKFNRQLVKSTGQGSIHQIFSTYPNYVTQFTLSRVSAKESIYDSFRSTNERTLSDFFRKSLRMTQPLTVSDIIAVPYFNKVYLRSETFKSSDVMGTNKMPTALNDNIKVSLTHDEGIAASIAASIAWTRQHSILNVNAPIKSNRILEKSEYNEGSIFRSGSYGVDVVRISRLLRFLRNSQLFVRFCQKFVPEEIHDYLHKLYISACPDCNISYISSGLGTGLLVNELIRAPRLNKLISIMSLCFSLSECLVKAFRSRIRFSFTRDFSVPCLSIDRIDTNDMASNNKQPKIQTSAINSFSSGKHNSLWQSISLHGDALEALHHFGWSHCSFFWLIVHDEANQTYEDHRLEKSPALCTVVRLS
ncbi:hypothetical protein XU18_4359 [Perkinsela sp. CCAP 1560/4]|nr:hypothetical protein XU18_4359 [Perkinsela sp. CCAP 1560/4]|eukprot:KNH04392.1 hypothetical protein XU18_4359 [Perkinsela sp. CCAP 1560/4]